MEEDDRGVESGVHVDDPDYDPNKSFVDYASDDQRDADDFFDTSISSEHQSW